MAIWELFDTECCYLKTLRDFIDVFVSCLHSLKQCDETKELFHDIDLKQLFCNIIDLFNCSLTFWQTRLYPIIETLKRNIQMNSQDLLIRPAHIVEAFSEFNSVYSSYEEFCLGKLNSLEYFKQKINENEFFKAFITVSSIYLFVQWKTSDSNVKSLLTQWAEGHSLVLVDRLKMTDFMMKPIQRITRYQLLFDNIYKFTDDENVKEQLIQTRDQVNILPNTINRKLNYLEQFHQLSESIEKYDGGIQGQTEEINEVFEIIVVNF